MRKKSSLLPAACGLLLGIGAGLASAQTAPAADAAAEDAPAFGAPVTVYAGTKEYVWTLYVPELTTERVAVVANVPVVHVRGRRWDYELPDLKSQRFKLGQVFEFSCKYSDWELPEQCRTEWHEEKPSLRVVFRPEGADRPQPGVERSATPGNRTLRAMRPGGAQDKT